ncbi:MAG TPA: alkyl sulfatase dimerization domain-containing protein [Kofleriaceae bacterium]|nr:alkyl sulfatase dimerization domain-containing protein [Kofleriaceae bacterium]
MTALRQLSEQLLSGAVSIDQAQPMAPRFLAEPVAAGSYFVSSFANVSAFDTDDGLVLVDTGSFVLAEPTRARLRGITKRPVHTAIWTHGHVDHCFGVDLYERDSGRHVRVIAHEAVTRRFERYKLTRAWNTAINQRQFQTNTEFPGEFRVPDETYQRALTTVVGGRRFELHHALGETDDHTWVWVPDAGVICTGDLFIWASPNCGNPQKVQRFPREWAQALRAMAALEPDVLLPGHGVPIWGREAVRRALDETATLLESLVDQVVTLMNAGARLDEIMARVSVDPALLARPYLNPIYDEPEFIVRNLYRLYGGWWDGNPAHLKPPRDGALAKEIVALGGGPSAVATRANRLATDGELALACELIEMAALAAPDNTTIQGIRADIYSQRAKQERSLMARGVYTAAADSSRRKS